MTTDKLKELLRLTFNHGDGPKSILESVIRRSSLEYIEQLEGQLSAQTAVSMTTQELANRIRNGEKWKLAETEQPSLSDARIYEFANAICTPTNGGWHFADGKALMLFARALLAQRQDSDMTFSGYFDEDEYQGITIEKFLKHRNESEGMDAWEIGHEFQVDAVYSRTEQWRVTNDVPWTAERIDCAAIANGAPK